MADPDSAAEQHLLVTISAGPNVEAAAGVALITEASAQQLGARAILDTGLVEESSHRPAPALDDDRRRYYDHPGRPALAAEIRRLERVLAAARAASASRSRA